jgi:membrane protein
VHEQPVPTQTGAEDGGRTPLDLGPKGWKQSVKRAAAEFKQDRAGLVAAGMAFYWFLAVFPSLVAAISILGLVNLSQQAADSITRAIRTALPGDAARVLTDAVQTVSEQPAATSLLTAAVGIALAVWSGSAGMVAVQVGLNVAYDVSQDRPFLKKRLRAIVLMGVTAVLGGAATALIVFGQPLGEGLRGWLPFDEAFVVAWTIIRWLAGLAVLTLLFATYFYLAPNRDSPRWVWLSPGGLLATVIWLLASLGFSIYVSTLGSYAETYGSLAGVVVLLLWLYLSALAVLVGGELNAELERQHAAERGQVPMPDRGREGAEGAERAGGADRPPRPPPRAWVASRAGRRVGNGDGGATPAAEGEEVSPEVVAWREQARQIWGAPR